MNAPVKPGAFRVEDILPVPPADAIIRFEGVGKIFVGRDSQEPVTALAGIDLVVPRGSIVGVIGRSGAGKSTLIRLVNGLERATSGRILIEGEDVTNLTEAGWRERRRATGMIFQHFNLLSSRTVFDNVALPLEIAGTPKEAIRQRVEELLALVGLSDKSGRYPAELSGGQKQRVGIARALAGRPTILLCDEATSALDPETTQSILALLKDINRSLGLTIMLITHEMSVIREICDEVLVLEKGEVAEAGPVWRVFGDPRHAATRALLAPLSHGLPEDLAGRVQPTPPRESGEALVELSFRGERDPDLGAITGSLGPSARLLSANLDRIGGHTQGRLFAALSLRAGARLDLPDNARVIGYVAADD